MLASDIIDPARIELFDPLPGIGYTNDELRDYLNQALRATAFVKPDMYPVQEFMTLAAGVLQELPADGVALFDVVRNANGRVVTQVDKGLLEEANRFWPAATQETTIEHYTADARNPRRFQVFPPSDGTSSVEVLYGAVPPQLNYDEQELLVPDSYQQALLSFVIGKALSKPGPRQDMARSGAAMAQWSAMLGIKTQAQRVVAPRTAAEPGVTT